MAKRKDDGKTYVIMWQGRSGRWFCCPETHTNDEDAQAVARWVRGNNDKARRIIVRAIETTEK